MAMRWIEERACMRARVCVCVCEGENKFEYLPFEKDILHHEHIILYNKGFSKVAAKLAVLEPNINQIWQTDS